MLFSEKLWFSLDEKCLTKSEWVVWSNKYGEDGSLVDQDDNCSFYHKSLKKAIYIMYEPEGNALLDTWESKSGDEESGIVDVLNVVFSHLDNAIVPFENAINQWLKT